jgi:hypothetical protein
MLNVKAFILGFIGLFIVKYSVAQDIDSIVKYTQPQYIHIINLQKSYSLGDGLVLKSSVGMFTFNQSLQTLYVVNSANNFNTTNSEFDINRARLNMIGNLFDKKLTMTMRLNFPANYQSATTGSRSFNDELEEANILYSPNATHTFSFGLRADYVDSREIRIEGEDFGFVERSAVSTNFDAIFDYGLRYIGTYHIGGKQVLRPYLSLTSGDGRSGLQKNYGGLKYGFRIDYLPFDEFDGSGENRMEDVERERRPKLVLGVVYSIDKGATSAYGTNGGRYLYGDANQNILLPDYSKYIFDYLFHYHGFYSMGSIVATKATVPSNIAGSFSTTGKFTAYTNQTSLQIKDNVLSELNLGTGYNIQAGYLLRSDWSFGGRYSYLNDNTITSNYVNYNRYYDVIATKYLSGNNLKIQFELGYNELKNTLQVSGQAKGEYIGEVMFCINL